MKVDKGLWFMKGMIMGICLGTLDDTPYPTVLYPISIIIFTVLTMIIQNKNERHR